MESIRTRIELRPTRRLNKREKSTFDGIRSSFSHLTGADSELLTMYAETAERYRVAARDAKKSPTLAVETFNKSTGNATGVKVIKNPAATMAKESLSALTSLARRLLIDPASAEKRQRLLTKKSRALQAAEQAEAEQTGRQFAEADIGAMMAELINRRYILRGHALRNAAIRELELLHDLADTADMVNDPEFAHLFAKQTTKGRKRI